MLDCFVMAPDAAAIRFRLALDLFATGEALMRQRLRRLHPDWTEDQIEGRMAEWLRGAPGAEAADALGRPTTPLG